MSNNYENNSNKNNYENNNKNSYENNNAIISRTTSAASGGPGTHRFQKSEGGSFIINNGNCDRNNDDELSVFHYFYFIFIFFIYLFLSFIVVEFFVFFLFLSLLSNFDIFTLNSRLRSRVPSYRRRLGRYVSKYCLLFFFVPFGCICMF